MNEFMVHFVASSIACFKAASNVWRLATRGNLQHTLHSSLLVRLKYVPRSVFQIDSQSLVSIVPVALLRVFVGLAFSCFLFIAHRSRILGALLFFNQVGCQKETMLLPCTSRRSFRFHLFCQAFLEMVERTSK
jgi:hypothetical protein